jgi:hypothetical protein
MGASQRPHYADQKGIIQSDFLGYGILAAAAALPAAGTSGYAPGCLFFLQAGTTFRLYVNEGTAAAANFVPLAALNVPLSVTDAALTLTAAAHANRTLLASRAAGVVLTLPAATGSGVRFRVVVLTTITSNAFVVQVTGNDVMVGSAVVLQDAADTVVAFETAADTDTVSGNGSTTGGVRGDIWEFEDVAADTWMVKGQLSATGAEATPFSAAV